MIVTSAEFIKSAVRPSQYPAGDRPEIAFSGRSNVGKSSLINTLLNRKKLVKTSAKPGRTQLLNFFEINRSFYFVDIPGYGYARVPQAVRRSWRPMIETYLSQSKNLRGVVLIMDIRRDPAAEERNLIDWLAHHHVARLLVLTKADKLSRNKQNVRRLATAKILASPADELIVFSAKSRQGADAVWQGLDALLESDANRNI